MATATSAVGWKLKTSFASISFVLLFVVLMVPASALDPPTPLEPGNYVELHTSTPTFKWTVATGASFYKLLVRLSTSTTYTPYSPIYATQYTLPSSLSDGTYKWCVASGYASVWSSCSPEWTFGVKTCTDECSPGTYRCLDTATKQSCANYDTDICYEWGGNINCNDVCLQCTCSAGSCGTGPPAPTPISPTNGQTIYTTTPTLDWSDVSSATKYAVYVKEGSSAIINGVQMTASQYAVPSGKLSVGHTYTWAVQSYGSGGWGQLSSWPSFNVRDNCTDECTPSGARQCYGSGYRTCGASYDSDSCLEWSPVASCSANQSCSNGQCVNMNIPAPPSPLSPPNGSTVNTTTPVLSWTAVSGAGLYCVFVSENATWNTTFCGSQASLPVPVSANLARGHTYKWKVRANVSGVWSNYSAPWRFTVDTCSNNLTCGLVAHWRFDEGNGTTAADSSGNANTGTLYNGPTWIAGKVGNALRFDGINDYVMVPHKPMLGPTSQLTLSLWLKPKSYPASGTWATLLTKEWLYYFNFESSGSVSGAARIAQNSGSRLQLNAYTHVALTYNGSVQRLYVNGALIRENVASGSTIDSWNSPVYMGRRGDGRYFNGTIDDVRIYNRALSASEIASLACPNNQCAVPAPALLSPLNGSTVNSTSTTLDWADVNGTGVGYGTEVYYSNDSLFTGLSVNQSQANISGLLNGQSYKWRVRALASGVYSNWTQFWTFVVSVKPPKPVLLSPANGSEVQNTTPALDWGTTANTDRYFYRIYNSTGAIIHDDWIGGSENSQTVVPQVLDNNASLQKGQTYRWQVWAHNGQFSDASDAWSFMVAYGGTPLKFRSYTPAIINTSSPVLSLMATNNGTADVTADVDIDFYLTNGSWYGFIRGGQHVVPAGSTSVIDMQVPDAVKADFAGKHFIIVFDATTILPSQNYSEHIVDMVGFSDMGPYSGHVSGNGTLVFADSPYDNSSHILGPDFPYPQCVFNVGNISFAILQYEYEGGGPLPAFAYEPVCVENSSAQPSLEMVGDVADISDAVYATGNYVGEDVFGVANGVYTFVDIIERQGPILGSKIDAIYGSGWGINEIVDYFATAGAFGINDVCDGFGMVPVPVPGKAQIVKKICDVQAIYAGAQAMVGAATRGRGACSIDGLSCLRYYRYCQPDLSMTPADYCHGAVAENGTSFVRYSFTSSGGPASSRFFAVPVVGIDAQGNDVLQGGFVFRQRQDVMDIDALLKGNEPPVLSAAEPPFRVFEMNPEGPAPWVNEVQYDPERYLIAPVLDEGGFDDLDLYVDTPYGRNPEISGAWYSGDMEGGVELILLPTDAFPVSIYVDAAGATQDMESYQLSLLENLNASSYNIYFYNSTIGKGQVQTYNITDRSYPPIVF